MISKVSRRRVLVGLTGVTAVAGGTGLWLVSERVRGWRFRNAVDRGGAFAPSAFVAVESSGDIVVWLVRSEMGQGVETALPMLVAEELDADWARVRVEKIVLDQRYDYGSLATAASASIQSMWTELRRAGATARSMLVAAAAELWDVSARELVTERGTVTHVASGRNASYGELASLAATQRAPLRPRLKTPAEFRLIGQSIPRRDVPAKIDGSAVFGIDARVPEMLHAAIARSPAFGGVLSNVDDAAARAIDGVVDVVRVPTGVAVVAKHSYGALRGKEALRLEWRSETPRPSSSEIASQLRGAASAGSAHVARDDGEALSTLERSARVHASTYEVPYLAHAPLEPMNCVASVTADRCEIWAPTQAPNDAVSTAARITSLPEEQITVHTTYLGGGFGRRTASDFVAEAVDLSSRLRKPVQVLWSREDDMRHGFYRPAVAQKIEAAIGDDGMPSAWLHRVASVSPTESTAVDWVALMGAHDLPYGVGQVRIEWAGVRAPVPTTIWRSVGHSFTTFAIESFLDELAHATGRDPVDYRLALLPAQSRLRSCIEQVAELSGWSPVGSAPRRTLGIAAAQCFGSYVALVVEVDQSASSGGIRVTRAWCVVDCGIAVHPDSVVAQIEGGIVFGLTAALMGRITVDDGKIVEGNFDGYPLLRIDETPAIEVKLVPSNEPPGGVGELGVPAVAPAVANAVFALHRSRLRTLPLALNA